ncbi:MAG TPA: hypothetical protein VMU24_05970, partial [Candidatus Acidoferrales bacterium]|nr:hypothetical protein [Candidatus Acidoferrales bacterium]
MFASVPDQKPVGPKPFLLSLAVHGIGALVLVYGASVTQSRVTLHPMIAPDLAENMIYLPPELTAHAAPDAPTAAPEEKPALTVPTKEQQEAKVQEKPEPKPEPKA